MFIYFHSLPFLLFFLAVFVLFWTTPKKTHWRHLVLLAASYTFYASWNYKLLSLILVSTATDYFCAQKVWSSNNERTRKLFLLLSLATNLGILFVFKYFNFFIESLSLLASSLDLNLSLTTLNIVLPIGISFYTFQTISYTVDVYKKRIQPEKNYITFSLFVGYFPQLIAGPIEKGHKFLPKLRKLKGFHEIDFKRGFYLFTLGFLKKVAIADALHPYVEFGFENHASLSSLETLLYSYLFLVEIYCDFSGYSNMARGISEFFGIRLSTNFNLPIFAKNPSDFWNRWHITLSDWVKVYLYIPLLYRWRNPFFASLICFPLMGLWHGAKWSFFLWGLYWFLATALHNLFRTKLPLKIPIVLQWFLTLHIVSLGLMLFKLENVSSWIATFANFAELSADFSTPFAANPIVGVFILIIFETYLLKKRDQLKPLNWPPLAQLIFYMLCFAFYRVFSGAAIMDFYYLQF